MTHDLLCGLGLLTLYCIVGAAVLLWMLAIADKIHARRELTRQM